MVPSIGSTMKVGAGVKREDRAVVDDSSPRKLIELVKGRDGVYRKDLRVGWISRFERCGNHIFNSLIGFGHKIRSCEKA